MSTAAIDKVIMNSKLMVFCIFFWGHLSVLIAVAKTVGYDIINH